MSMQLFKVRDTNSKKHTEDDIKYPQTSDAKNCLKGTIYKHVDQVSLHFSYYSVIF